MEFFEITTVDEAKEFINIIPDVVSIDTEYVKGDPRTTELLSVIVADSDRAWAIVPALLPMLTETIRARKLIFLQDYNHCDTTILLKHGCDLRETECHNLIDIHHLIDENAEHDLGSRVLLEYGDGYKKEFWSKYKNFEDAPHDEALEYECKDAIYTYRLGVSSLNSLSPKVLELYGHVRELSRALFETELNGLTVNEPLIRQTKETMSKQINECLPKLRSEFNDYCEIWELQKWAEKLSKYKTSKGALGAKRPTFSFASDTQLQWLLYSALELPSNNKTKTGNPSTDYDTLKELSESHPQVRPVFEYKEIKAVYSTFVDGMLERVKNERIFPNFNVSGTSTGRISHSNPNMGNLPKEGVIRNFFIPSPGSTIIGADYAQLEVVIELNLTDDPGLKEIVLGGANKHDLFKADLDKAGFNIPRSQVKNINFALQYGAGAKKISSMVSCSQHEAERVIATFYTRFSGVKTLKDDTASKLKAQGYITNLAGRTRHFPKPRNDYEKGKYERQAYNFLIQGVAAEACNRAYYRFANFIKRMEAGRALFSVHDEIVAEISKNWSMEDVKVHLVRIMEQSTEDFNFKYKLQAVPYGPLSFWCKA